MVSSPGWGYCSGESHICPCTLCSWSLTKKGVCRAESCQPRCLQGCALIKADNLVTGVSLGGPGTHPWAPPGLWGGGLEVKGQSHPQRSPGQAQLSAGTETGIREGSSLRGGGWGLGGPGVALEGGCGALRPISTARVSVAMASGDRGRKGPREEQRVEWGQQACVVTSPSQAGLCSEAGPHTGCCAPRTPTLPLPLMDEVLAGKLIF